MNKIKGNLTLDEYSSQNIRDEINLLSLADLRRLEGSKHKSLDIWNEYPHLINPEVIQSILKKLDGDILTPKKPYQITKDVIRNLTSLCNVGDLSKKKSIRNVEVEPLTGIRGDQRALIIESIEDPLTRYVAHGISYKIFFRNQGSTSTGATYIAHKMIIENEDFDLCNLVKDQLMENVQLTKDIDYPFRFGTLVICIMMYFLNYFLVKGNAVWR